MDRANRTTNCSTRLVNFCVQVAETDEAVVVSAHVSDTMQVLVS
jgi:hypothetical protein